MPTVKPRNASEQRLLDEVSQLGESVRAKILNDHEVSDMLKAEAHMRYKEHLQRSGLEGAKMLEFLRRIRR